MNLRTIIITLAAATALSAAHAQRRIAPRTAVACAKAERQRTMAAYIHLNNSISDAQLAAAGAQVQHRYGNIVTARIDVSRVAEVADIEGVAYVETAAAATTMLDVSRPAIGMDAVHSGEAVGLPFTGRGVVVGIVDSGFDYGHAAFRNTDGSLRIKRVWEQASESGGKYPSPEGYGYGVELTTEEEILAAEGDITSNSHGTHVASIATGSDTALDGKLKGMAPEADIVLVSMTETGTNNVNISDAIAYIFDYADEKGMPCVVNLSLGNHSGPHDGTSTFDTLVDNMTGAGRLIVGSAGNHRADRFHVRRDYAGATDTPLRTFLEYKSTPSVKNLGGNIELWCSAGVKPQVALVAYKLDGPTEATRVQIYPATESPATVTLGRNITGSLTVAVEDANPANGKTHVLISSAVEGIRTGYGIAIEVLPQGEGAVDIWADNAYLNLSSNDLDGFVAPTDESTICEIGGTANSLLTVGSYTTRSKYTLYGETAERTLAGETDGALSLFSSCGPTADGRIKPEVTAPGCFISAAVSNHDNSGTIMRSAYHWDDSRDYSYGFMQGTSMSSPMVAGIVATWLQACPTLTPEQLHTVIAETSTTDEHTGDITKPLPTWGYGKINPKEGLAACLNLAGIKTTEANGTQKHSLPAIYNTQGQAVRYDGSTTGLPKGVYIMGGRKIIIGR